MDNQEIQNEEIEINLAELFQVLKSEHLHIIIISTLICAILVELLLFSLLKKNNMLLQLESSQNQKLTRVLLITLPKLTQIIR